jgi:hypothetical protein
MRNITVAISDDTYRRARIWAAERNGSISAIVQYLLETLPGIRRSALAFPIASTKTDTPRHAQRLTRQQNLVNTYLSAYAPLPPPQKAEKRQ